MDSDQKKIENNEEPEFEIFPPPIIDSSSPSLLVLQPNDQNTSSNGENIDDQQREEDQEEDQDILDIIYNLNDNVPHSGTLSQINEINEDEMRSVEDIVNSLIEDIRSTINAVSDDGDEDQAFVGSMIILPIFHMIENDAMVNSNSEHIDVGQTNYLTSSFFSSSATLPPFQSEEQRLEEMSSSLTQNADNSSHAEMARSPPPIFEIAEHHRPVLHDTETFSQHQNIYLGSDKSDGGEDENREIAVDEYEMCSVCCVNQFKKYGNCVDKITCRACLFSACVKCVKKAHEMTPGSIFLECMGCKQTSISIKQIESNKKLKPLLHTSIKHRIMAHFINREKRNLPNTQELAQFYSRQRIIMSHLNKFQFLIGIRINSLYDIAALGDSAVTIRIEPFKIPTSDASPISNGDFATTQEIDSGFIKTYLRNELMHFVRRLSTPNVDRILEEEEFGMKLIRVLFEIVKFDFGLRSFHRQHDSSILPCMQILDNIYLNKTDPQEEFKVPLVEARQILESHSLFFDFLNRIIQNIPIRLFTKNCSVLSDVLAEFAIHHCNTLIYDDKYMKNIIIATINKISKISEEELFISTPSAGNVVQEKCLRKECRGYMKILTSEKKLECCMCGSQKCLDCNEPIINPFGILQTEMPSTQRVGESGDSGCKEHVCDPNISANIKLIRSTSRPCPKCGTYITKIEGGCRHMFCTQCSQPYDWETLVLNISNTNPIYHEWFQTLQETNRSILEYSFHRDISQSETAPPRLIKSEQSNLTDLNDFSVIRNAFTQSVIGSDGLSKKGRILELIENMKIRKCGTFVGLLKVIDQVNELIEQCIKFIDLPETFEHYRILYLLGDLTEAQWNINVGKRGLTSFLVYKIILTLDAFSQLSLQEILQCVRDLETIDIKSVLARSKVALCLFRCVRLATEVNKNISSLFAIGGIIKSRAPNRSTFRDVKKYFSLFEMEMQPTTSFSTSITNNSSLDDVHSGHHVSSKDDNNVIDEDAVFAKFIQSAEFNLSLPPSFLGLSYEILTNSFLKHDVSHYFGRSSTTGSRALRTRTTASNAERKHLEEMIFLENLEEQRILKIFNVVGNKGLMFWIEESLEMVPKSLLTLQ